MNNSNRLQYFDVLKGFAILLVVMGHVLTMCIRDIDNTLLFKIIERTHMPLFFFISGYFSFKCTTKGVPHDFPQLAKRFMQLIVPFVAVSSLWIIYFPHSGLQSPIDSTLTGLYFNEWKNGYWFTLCLFEIILVYTAIIPALRLSHTIKGNILIITATWAMLWILLRYVFPDNISSLLSFRLVFSFFPIFMAGVLAKKYVDSFYRNINKSGIYTSALIAIGVTLYYLCYYWEFPWINGEFTYIAGVILHISLAIVATVFVKNYMGHDNKSGIIVNTFTLWGKESLTIYLLHYFFLFPLGWLRQPLIDMGLGFVPALIVSAIPAVVIITAVTGVNAIIGKSRLLSLLLTGKL